MIGLGILISFLLHYITKTPGIVGNNIFNFLSSIIITALVWEGNLRIDFAINLRFPWEVSPVKRVLVHLPISLFYTSTTIYVSMVLFNKYICHFPSTSEDAFMGAALIIGVMVSLIILAVEIGIQFFNQWKLSLIELEKYKTESSQAQLQNLKNQINPHFLFNNMSVLSSLVYQNQDKAVDFINQLSKVYRYLLDNKDCELVTLEDELKFIRSYTYLLQIRFEESIHFHIDIDKETERKLLPPMALQILIENAIKHNEISSEFPLTISIKTQDDVLIIENNLRLRSQPEPSLKTGLKNIKDRYSFFTDLPIEIIDNTKTFIVKIPLLQTK